MSTRRDVQFNPQPKNQPTIFRTVAEALLWTLQQGLGEEFTPDVAAAWVAAYRILAEVMKAAAAEVDEAMAVATN